MFGSNFMKHFNLVWGVLCPVHRYLCFSYQMPSVPRLKVYTGIFTVYFFFEVLAPRHHETLGGQ